MGSDRVAGVIFYLEESDLKEAVEGFSGTARLSAKVSDIELWEAMVHQLTEGLPLYRGKDFKQQIIEVLQEDQEKLKEQSERQVRALTAELERYKQLTNQLQADLTGTVKMLNEYEQLVAQMNGQSTELLRAGQELAQIAQNAMVDPFEK